MELIPLDTLASVDSEELGNWMLSLVSFAGLLLVLKKLVEKPKQLPQPVSVDIVKHLATKEEVEHHVDKIWEQFKEERRIMNSEFSKIDTRINKLLESTANLKGVVESQIKKD